jgi:hypothetical protein
MDRRHVSFRVVNVTWLGFVGFHSPFSNQFWIASRLICSFREGMAGSLSVATTAVLLAKVGEVDSGEVVCSV